MDSPFTPDALVDDLDELHERAVAKDDSSDERVHERVEVDESERRVESRDVRQDPVDREEEDGEGEEDARGGRLVEGNLVGAEEVDDERLGRRADDEPVRLGERDVGVVGRRDSVVEPIDAERDDAVGGPR